MRITTEEIDISNYFLLSECMVYNTFLILTSYLSISPSSEIFLHHTYSQE